MKQFRSVIACLVLAAFAAGATIWGGPAAAQTEPAAEDSQLKALIEELSSQLDRGEKERLIDPWYLRDLRKVLGRYENPWDTILFSDDFSGRGPQPEPPWKVTAGEFLIDWRYGLRSVIEAPAPASAPETKSSEDTVQKLFGQLLQQTLQGQQNQQDQQEAAAPAAPSYAAAIAPVKITNAFALRLELTARPVPGVVEPRFEFGPYQGANASAGYRLAYNPGAAGGTPSLELLRLTSRGTSTLELSDKALKFEDGKSHVVEWTRDSGGRMVIRVDDVEVITVTDRSFRDPFDGIALVNSGGDYALRSVAVAGTSQ